MFERVAEFLREKIRKSMQPGERFPGIKVLSTELGVSEWTLRSAQALLSKEGILEVRHGSGVYVAQGKKTTIGIYSNLDVLQPRSSRAHQLTIHFLRKWLIAQGLRCEVYIGNVTANEQTALDPHSRFAEDVHDHRLDGLVMLNVPETSAWIEWYKTLTIPVVGSLTRYCASNDYPQVIKRAVGALVNQGCQKLALLDWDTGHSLPEFQKAIREQGLAYHPEWVRGNLHPMLAGAGWEEFREIWLAQKDKPDGIIIGDDLLYREASHAIQELGVDVPGELKLVAQTNKYAPPPHTSEVTVIEYDHAKLAKIYGECLLKLMQGESPDPQSLVWDVKFRHINKYSSRKDHVSTAD